MRHVLMTIEDLKLALPKGLQHQANQEFADKVNSIAAEPETAEEVRNNFITYAKVLQEGKYKTEDYLNAVTYCTFKIMGYTNRLCVRNSRKAGAYRIGAAGHDAVTASRL